MCGIAGIAALPGAKAPAGEAIAKMCVALRHRGPDDDGLHVDGEVALGMRRLAVIDVAGGHQPVFNEDHTVRAIVNGEIYNYRELRAGLESRGHVFTTKTDTEVVVHLWEEKGVDFPGELNGMFAIALHDTRTRTLLLVRDHLGIKPLFYVLTGEYLIFASEIKAVLAAGMAPRELDVDALGQFMAWEYVPGRRTLLKSVHKLEPGCWLRLDLARGQVSERRFWDVPPAGVASPGASLSAAQWEERIDDTVRRCVRRQLVSDVPLGAFLSGGVDSSLVVAHMPEGRTFSIGFRDPSYDELPWARRVARHLELQHRAEIIEPRRADLFETVMPFLDDPIGDVSVFATYLVSRLARQDVTVALSGDGGDELFGGYETYRAQLLARHWHRAPALVRRLLVEPLLRGARPAISKKGFVNKAKRFVEGLQHSPELGHARWRLFVGEAMRRRLFSPDALRCLVTPVGDHIDVLAQRAAHREPVDRSLYIDLKSYLVDNCLVKVDRMSMANSLEARVPLLDKELVELAFQMPTALKVTSGRTKVLLKRVASRHVPPSCVYRPKEGFSIPMKTWLKADFRPLMEELLAPSRLRAEGLVDAATVEQLKAEHLANRANHSHVLWCLMVFQDWRRRWAV